MAMHLKKLARTFLG